MSLRQRQIFRAAVMAGASHLLSASLLAQAVTSPPVPSRSNTIPVGPPGARAAAMAAPAPPLPLARSPIGFFRELLAMSAAERQQTLGTRSPESRSQILAKVREYESLKPDERELRLRVTELCWYLRPLMTSPPTNRPGLLALIPEPDRELVEDRLRDWDQISAEVQQELLGLEPTLQYLAEIEGLSELQRAQILNSISPARRKLLEKGMQQWEGMSEDQRQDTLHRFKQFFQLTAREKEMALKTLSEPERRQIEKTLETFGRLPPDQRAECIRSFAKFTSLSLAERQQFLKNAERWKQMSPSERQSWRQLVSHLPPLPPRRPPPLPPASIPRARPTPTIATNRN
jgi:hypothetical protein